MKLPNKSADTNALMKALLKQLEARRVVPRTARAVSRGALRSASRRLAAALYALCYARRLRALRHLRRAGPRVRKRALTLRPTAAQADKPKAGLGDDDALFMEGFALKIFNSADSADRAGTADVKTAMKLYAACCFFQVLAQFGEPAPDVLAKQKYAAWRAAEISGALKKGRVPAPPPGADDVAAQAGGAPAGDAPASAAAGEFPAPPTGVPHALLPPPSSPGAAFGFSPGSAVAATPPRSPAGRPSLSATPSPPPGACLRVWPPLRPC